MKTLPTFFLLLATLAISAGQAQESPITGPPPCRFLFFVESSKGMARISSGTAATVAGLVESGVSGLMRPGDSFALWHFNEEPFQFDFPNRVWQPDQAAQRATEARVYIQNQRFTKPVRADLALREMFIAMRATDPLTVVLISNGESPMVGTPFDVEINKVYLRRGEELRKARLPFVTTLRCVNRQIENAAVTAGREEIVLPELVSKAASVAAAGNSAAAASGRIVPAGVVVTPPAPVVRPAISTAGGAPPLPPVLPPSTLVRERITDILAPPFAASATNGALGIAAAAPVFPTPLQAVESPLTALRISAVRTNGESAVLPPPQLPPLPAADLGSAIVSPRLSPLATATTGTVTNATSIFPRKSAPSFALENAGPRATPSAPAAVASTPPPAATASALVPARLPAAVPAGATPAKPLVPERIPESLKRNAGVTNAGGKTLATVPPLIRPEATTRPVHFLFAGLVLLAVAGWFIVLIFRGGRRQSRSSISRAMDE